MPHPSVRTSALIVALATPAGCDADNTSIRRLPLEPTASPGRMVVSPPSLSLGFSGAQGELGVRITTLDGDSVTGVNVAWTSIDPGVATVSSTGLVTAVQEGSTSIPPPDGSPARVRLGGGADADGSTAAHGRWVVTGLGGAATTYVEIVDYH